jgi:hypothetical protein
MGLVKRNNIWWMSFTFQGRQVRRSTETSDKKLAEAILSKVRVQIVEGKVLSTSRKRIPRTFPRVDGSVFERACQPTVPLSSLCEHGDESEDILGNPKLEQMTPKTIVAYKSEAVCGWGHAGHHQSRIGAC